MRFRPYTMWESCGDNDLVNEVLVCVNEVVWWAKFGVPQRQVMKRASPDCYGGKQYMSAVWAEDAEKAEITQRVAKEMGKEGVPVLSASSTGTATFLRTA